MPRLFASLLCVFAVALFAVPVAAVGKGGVEFYAADLKWVLLAAPGSGAVQVLDVSRGVTPLATLRSAQRGKVLAVHVQRASRRVWVLADSGLDVHDGFNGHLLGHWAPPQGGASRAPRHQRCRATGGVERGAALRGAGGGCGTGARRGARDDALSPCAATPGWTSGRDLGRSGASIFFRCSRAWAGVLP